MKTKEKFNKKLAKLDLEPIIFKLVKDPDSEIPWSLEKADYAAQEYKKFLTLYYLYKGKGKILSPNKLVDQFWHQHQLDSEKYREDCELLFANTFQIIVSKLLRAVFNPLGICIHATMVDHFPYFGMRGEEDAENLAKSYRDTVQLGVEHFG